MRKINPSCGRRRPTLMLFTIGKYRLGSLLQLGQLMATFYVTCLIFIFVVLGTWSSESVLPRMMTKMENLGERKSVVGLVNPPGYSFNLGGTAIYLTMAALFIAQATNTPVAAKWTGDLDTVRIQQH